MSLPWKTIPWSLLALSTALALAHRANAQQQQPGFYMGASVGYEQIADNEVEGIDVDAEPGYVIGGQLGYHSGNVRTEAEISVLVFELDDIDGIDTDADAEIYRYTISLYYDFDLAMMPIPYAGAGLGLATVDADGFEDKTNFTWHGELGVAFPLNADIEFVPSYRYEWIDESGLLVDDPLTGHIFKLGARVRF